MEHTRPLHGVRVLDLKDPADRAVFTGLVRGADALLENIRAGVLSRLGFGWAVLHGLNPRLVYCAISGSGQTGPMSRAPAYDQIIQGLSGMMSITGTPETAPLRVGFPVSDTVGGLVAAMAIGLNNAVATGVNLLGDVHGGAGEQCMALLAAVRQRHAEGAGLDAAAAAVVGEWRGPMPPSILPTCT